MPHGNLDAYRRKRSSEATPEPMGSRTTAAGGRFVVQKHAARRVHFDLRLELEGTLKSWAVPRGPSLDPDVKRLAVATEDHPLEYADFEGSIPAGNYGAGAMIVWDSGRWVPLEDPVAGMESGKLLFELHGYKLRGVWTLFRTAGRRRSSDGSQWLLMKKPDAAARPSEESGDAEDELPPESVLSGLTVEELRDGCDRIEEVRAGIEASDAPRRRVDPRSLPLMLATASDRPFSRAGWIYELKYDGYRLVAAKEGGSVFLRYRRGGDVTALYPELARALRRLPVESIVLDGEVTVLDGGGRPSFARLQTRALLNRPVDIEQASVRRPATLFAFDLVSFEGHDLRPLPLLERKGWLARVLPPAGPLRYSDHIEERGEEFFEQAVAMGLEGTMAKDGASRYTGRRSSSWVKLRAERTGDFAIVGMSSPKGSRVGLGSLHLAVWDAAVGGLVYAGRVGTGFDDATLAELAERLSARRRKEPPCWAPSAEGPAVEAALSDAHLLGGRVADQTWVEPDDELVCEVRFKEWTPHGLLRHPVFLRLRDDKPIEDCVRRDEPRGREATLPAPPERRVEITNKSKVFWPDEGYTKGDLIDFYAAISEAMQPYLTDRPLVMTRYPDGIEGKSFFQKNAPDFAPDWLHKVRLTSPRTGKDIEYFVCQNRESLVYVANLAAIVLHVWSSRLHQLGQPDWCILDLDPKDAPFEDVIEIALAIRRLCHKIKLSSFVKTSGSSGLHVLLPLGGACTWEQSRSLGQLIAQIICRQLPEIATVTRNPERRGGKVYIDFVQNGRGRLLVAPFSVRPLPAAPVSTPLRWSEVKPGLDLRDHNIRTVPERLKKLKTDPLRGVLTEQPDLLAALRRLSELV
ncbi:MAG: DNA ligase D [Holophagales bacterium]|nr:DNA ligase D [Holophagales bacterium]MYF05141.1 DNA ligase D [Holophagales bacterium]MYJ26808.1 DNA ligase D [Holophagales bacterium]